MTEKSNNDIRRLLNIVTAIIGLIITAPLMALIAIIIKLTSRGPIIYKQVRVGINRRSLYSPNRSYTDRRKLRRPLLESVDRRNDWYVAGRHRRENNTGGILFTMYKFRTMTVGTAAEQWAKREDPRVTSVGRILRKFRLDELPQLYNVLRGDMNVVGPRPEQVTIFATLRDKVFGYDIRQRVHPGITGWAQINQSYDTCIEDVERKIGYDLEYVARASIGYDVKIMMKTIPAVVFKYQGW